MVFLLVGGLLLRCQPTDPVTGLPDEALLGDQLAQRYCASCHRFPEPALLDKATWTSSVLPAMAWRLGIRDTTYRPPMGRNMREQFLIRQAGIFPDSARLSLDSWQRIVHYYDSLAPATLPLPTETSLSRSLAPFAAQSVSLGLSTGGLSTLLRQHPETGDIYLADGTRMLYQLDSAGETKDFFELPGPVSDLHFGSNRNLYLLAVGNLDPHDEPLGELLTMDAQGNHQSLIQGLSRPVHMNWHDLDQDGREDVVICEFGNYIGRLSWFRKTADGAFEKRVLWENPGAVKTAVRDLDRDGRPDLLVLMAQGREGIYAFYNQGDGQFRMKPLLQFPPVYGSSDFALADIDQDGDEDLLLVQGDNADLSPVLKPYHGLRVYRNDGDYRFFEAYFYPMHGATRVVSEDFDTDGDIDIAVSAYFPDFGADHPRSFVYLENTSTDSLKFIPHSLGGLNQGRWLLMETLRQDGHPALMLGAFNMGMGRQSAKALEHWQTANVNLMILKNKR